MSAHAGEEAVEIVVAAAAAAVVSAPTAVAIAVQSQQHVPRALSVDSSPDRFDTPPVSSLTPAPLPQLLHRRQTAEWDCGVACVYSLLVHLGEPTLLYGTLLQQVVACERRIWSIDLAFLLHAYGVEVAFRSLECARANPAHSAKPFYDEFARDTERVARVFTEAKRFGMNDIQQTSLSSEEIVRLLRSQHFLIFLLDHRFMRCETCKVKKIAEIASQPAPTDGSTSEFAGHFVLAYGLDPVTQHVVYLDPSVPSKKPCSMTLDTLERARKSEGTDEDIVIVHVPSHAGRIPRVLHATAVGFVDEPDLASGEALRRGASILD